MKIMLYLKNANDQANFSRAHMLEHYIFLKNQLVLFAKSFLKTEKSLGVPQYVVRASIPVDLVIY